LRTTVKSEGIQVEKIRKDPEIYITGIEIKSLFKGSFIVTKDN